MWRRDLNGGKGWGRTAMAVTCIQVGRCDSQNCTELGARTDGRKTNEGGLTVRLQVGLGLEG